MRAERIVATPPPPPQDEIVLVLTMDEANILKAIGYTNMSVPEVVHENIDRVSYDAVQQVCFKLRDALASAGVGRVEPA